MHTSLVPGLRRVRGALLVLAALAGGVGMLALAPVTARAQEGGWQVVVHAENPVTTIDEPELARYFWRRTRVWKHGGTIEPVDQGDASPVRQAFSKDVLGKTVTQVKAYWQGQVFTGQGSAPSVKKGDAEVLAHVAASRAAIGYVSAATELPAGVKRVVVAK